MKKNHILILNPSPKRLRALEVAKEMNLKISIADTKLNPIFQNYINRFIDIDLTKIDRTLSVLKTEHEKESFSGVITFLDRGVEPSSIIASNLGLRGNPLLAAKATRHKYLLRETLKKNGIKQPRFQKVASYEDFVEAADYVGYPFIFKPVGSASSKAIFKVEENTNLEKIYQKMLIASDPSLDLMFSLYPNTYIVEQFMIGNEFSVEGVASEGEIYFAGITEKWKDENYFIEQKHLFPARLTEFDENIIYSTAKSALSAIYWKCGAFHLELMLTHDGPQIVEINGRLGGDYITTHLVELARGVNIIKASYSAALGLPINIKQKWDKGACVHFKFAHREGVLKSLNGAEHLKDSPHIKDIIFEKNIGDLIRLPPKKFDECRLVGIVTQADTSEQALNVADVSINQITAEITD